MIRILAMIISIPVLSFALLWWWKSLSIVKWGVLSSLLGTTSNFLAIAVNGWRMPVIGARWWEIAPGQIWVVAHNPRLPWLVDRFQCTYGIYSVGDVMLVLGAALSTVLLLYVVVSGRW